MDVHFVSDDGIKQHPVEDLTAMLAGDDGLVWVDIPVADEEAARVLGEVVGLHPLAVQACVERNAVPRSGPGGTTSSSSCTAPSWARAATSTTWSWTRSSAPTT
jgi:hypothetical protein